jgi:hypothetical protein
LSLLSPIQGSNFKCIETEFIKNSTGGVQKRLVDENGRGQREVVRRDGDETESEPDDRRGYDSNETMSDAGSASNQKG